MNLALAYAAEVWVIVPVADSPNGADFARALDSRFFTSFWAAQGVLEALDPAQQSGMKVQACMLVPISQDRVTRSG